MKTPRLVEAMLGFSGALGKALDVKTRERIAIAVAQANGCDYCLSAHTYVGLHMAKINEAEIALNRRGASSDAKANAAVAFARKITETRGRGADAEFEAVRAAGYTDAQIIEIIAVVSENIFTNLVNVVVGTEIDFPVVLSSELA